MSLLALRALLRKRPLQLLVSVVLAGSIGALLVATIYWTLFDPRWIAFLGGVVFAAVLAMASHASRAQWVALRRTRQLLRMREKFEQANARSAAATEAFKTVEARMRALGDALTQPVFLLDRQQVCRFHNGAAAHAAGLRDDAIDGRALHEIVGEAAYVAMKPQVEASLAGRALGYELLWENAAGKTVYAVRQMPYPPNAIPSDGLCASRRARRRAAAGRGCATAAPPGRGRKRRDALPAGDREAADRLGQSQGEARASAGGRPVHPLRAAHRAARDRARGSAVL